MSPRIKKMLNIYMIVFDKTNSSLNAYQKQALAIRNHIEKNHPKVIIANPHKAKCSNSNPEIVEYIVPLKKCFESGLNALEANSPCNLRYYPKNMCDNHKSNQGCFKTNRLNGGFLYKIAREMRIHTVQNMF